MEPLSLAAAAIGLLVPYFKQAAGTLVERASETIADSALPKVKVLYERLRAKLAPGSYHGALLDGVQADPDDAVRQENLKAELAKVVVQDRQFAAELAQLVAEAEEAGGVQVTATDAGVVAGGNVHQHGQYVAGRDLTVSSPPPEQS